MDCTSDVSHSEQLIILVQFVNVKSVELKEHFIGFANIGESSAAFMTEVVLEVLNNYNISIMDCHGQGYDNGANMAGKNSGLQKRILDINPLGYFSNSACHCLNLVLCDCAQSSPTFLTNFGVLQKLYAFFSSSTKCWDI